MSLGPRCQHPGCPRSRIPLSIFCEQHHLRQLGIEPDAVDDPCAGNDERFRSYLRDRADGVISDIEFCDVVLDILVDSTNAGFEHCWDRWLDTLPPDAINGLMLHLRGLERPRQSFPPPQDEFRRALAEQKALTRHELLLDRLVNWIPPDQRICSVRAPPGLLVWFVKWLVPNGAFVSEGTPICEFEIGGSFGPSPEASTDWFAPVTGFLERGDVVDGARVEPGAVIGQIRQVG